jgi:hypothetical protein
MSFTFQMRQHLKICLLAGVLDLKVVGRGGGHAAGRSGNFSECVILVHELTKALFLTLKKIKFKALKKFKNILT